ncbi:MAG TPA: thioredoxin domain-containing protein [Beijerinckiaceae bacterium]|nr:thioredoxin domain-containing protein [Beijerinckiaceae bacterium]
MAPNRLAQALSPYLLQHSGNPVDWWPWRTDAFELARQTQRPVFLSIGYAACHWCHVMAHESFEDPETAALMNELFVNVKVDREERPDIDQIYMAALHALGQQGGWPLSMFLTPDGQPFWGGTYFPKTRRYGQPAFSEVLRSVARAYHANPDTIRNNTEALIASLAAAPAEAGTIPPPDRLVTIARAIAGHFDPLHGGLAGAPKFPNAPVLDLISRAATASKDPALLTPVLTTLERMVRGGLFDQIGGGFHRYSVDAAWLVPHFEKMLYDTAQLLPILAMTGRSTASELLLKAADRCVEWLKRDMIAPQGGFISSLDADSLTPDGHREEGAYYTWTPDEVTAVLGPAAAPLCKAFDIMSPGNFDGRSIPNRLGRTGLHPPASDNHDVALDALLAARLLRPPPPRDDKVLADWNGMMITGLARAADKLDHPDWRKLATSAYRATVELLEPNGNLRHVWRGKPSVGPCFASDLASMALAATALHESTGDLNYIPDAERWLTTLITDYRLPSGRLALTARSAEPLIHRPQSTQDDAVPNHHALAIEAMIRLGAQTGDLFWHQRASSLMSAVSEAMLDNPYGHASLLSMVDFATRRCDILVAGQIDAAFAAAIRAVPYPNRTIRFLTAAQAAAHPLTAALPCPDQPNVLICLADRCLPMATTLPEFRDRLATAGWL